MRSPFRPLPSVIAERFGPQLDAAAEVLGPWAEGLGPGPLKDLLSGTIVGHPVHPVLTDVTIGAWTGAAMLDVLGGARSQRGADALVGLGVLSAAPTALTGIADWADVTGEDRRVGMAHAVGNAAATAIYAVSWVARKRGHRGLGVALSMLGFGVASGTAYLGGHLVFARGVGVDVTVFDRLPAKYTPVMDEADLPEGTPTMVDVKGVPVFLLRRGDTVLAMHNECTHHGGPLHKGTLEGDEVTCPWHGSCFRVTDGEIVRGPATAPQPTFTARIHEGKIEVKR